MTKLIRALGAAALLWLAASPAIEAQQHSMANTRVRYYRNVSSSAITSHSAVFFSLTDSDVTTGADDTSDSTIGFDIDTTTVADSRLFAGVTTDSTCPAGTVCRVAVEGPVLVRFAGTTDNLLTVGNAVGTTTVAGMLGSGTGAGVLLSRNTASASACQISPCDGELRWVYIRTQEP